MGQVTTGGNSSHLLLPPFSLLPRLDPSSQLSGFGRGVGKVKEAGKEAGREAGKEGSPSH